MTTHDFKRVLVANRGEIAIRVMRALKDLGKESVAVYSDADRDAPHVRFADHAVAIGPAQAKESYLAIEKILDAAKRTGAEAIHPGYGFLSENAAFSAACDKAGIVFIGPDAASIEAVGDKAAARRVAESAGVPVCPGYMGEDSNEALLAAATRIGLPVLLKPAGGGGGKGMKVVERAEDLAAAADLARREAERAFGNATLILEKYVRPARHIEIQVFGDGRGKAIALGERECTLQRRHQKIVEESPSPVMDETLRAAMSAAAVRLAEKVKYRGAGTCEFLLGPDRSYYFLEMNTRLQVEHPVTEMIFGVDLVRAQIAVAEGRGLPDWLVNARARGHAIEVRLYAEDVPGGFLPAPGRALRIHMPEGPGVRVDAALAEPLEVSMHYDPMIAKIIAYGRDREEARTRLRRALAETVVLGLTTNLEFLAWLAREPFFAEGDFHTHTIAETVDRFLSARAAEPLPLAVLAAAAIAWKKDAHAGRGAGSGDLAAAAIDPFTELGPWRAFEKPCEPGKGTLEDRVRARGRERPAQGPIDHAEDGRRP